MKIAGDDSFDSSHGTVRKMLAQVQHRLFTVEEYEQMAAAGILGEDDGVELIEGEIIEMSPISVPHAVCVKKLNRLFTGRLGDRVIVGVQDPIRLDDRSEPQPDIVLLRPRSDFYAQGHPEPEDIILVIEVAETSVEYDREVKMLMYARAGIEEAWLINLRRGSMEVYRRPTMNGYTEMMHLRPGDTISPLAFPELVLNVSDILP
jgi:Uma2 family endonuclease